MEPDAYSRYMAEVEAASPSRMERMAERLRSLGHKMSVIPVVNFLSFFYIPTFLTAAAALLDSLGAASRGRYVESMKNMVAGGVDTVATTLSSWNFLLSGAPVFWLGSAFSGIATGDTLPELLRQGTKSVLDGLDGGEKKPDPLTVFARQNQVIGMQPQTVGSQMAGVGYAPYVPQPQLQAMPAALQPTGYPGQNMPPNYWTDTIARQEGVNPQQRRARWMSGEDNRQHYQELVAARQQQALAAPQRT